MAAGLLTGAQCGHRLVVAGYGGAYMLVGEELRKLPISDIVRSAISVDNGVLLAGTKGVYHVDSEGSCSILLAAEPVSSIQIHSIFRRVLVFARSNGTYEWDGHALKQSNLSFPWDRDAGVSSVYASGPDEYLISSSTGLYEFGPTHSKQLLATAWPKLLKKRILSVCRFGNVILINSHYGGVAAYNIDNESLIWQISPEQLGGNLFLAQVLDGNLLLGTASRLLSLPNFDIAETFYIGEGDVLSATISTHGMLVGLSSGVYNISTGERIFADAVQDVLELAPGEYARAIGNSIHLRNTSVDAQRGDIRTLLNPADGSIVAINAQGFTVISTTKIQKQVNVPSVINSAALRSDGSILLGTSDGAAVYTLEGKLLLQFGNSITYVSSLRPGAAAIDVSGSVYDENGERKCIIPGLRWSQIERVADSWFTLAEFKHSEFRILKIDPIEHSWIALDIPLPRHPQTILSDGSNLFVAASGVFLRIKKFIPAAPPTLAGIEINGKAVVSDETKVALDSAEDSLSVRFPLQRYRPWSSATYNALFDGNPIEYNREHNRLDVPRVPWGTSHLTITTQFGGRQMGQNYTIVRQWPWWGRPAAIMGYIFGIGLAGYAAVRLRTRSLEQNTRKLEEIVNERTAELRRAQKAREEFFSTLSHEIRNPLNGVVGLCEILNRGDDSKDPEKQKTLLRTLQGCSDQLRSIIDDVLDFTRIDRGEIMLRREPFEINAAIEGAVRAVDTELARTTVDAMPGPTWLLGDEGKVRQIVTNLVSNALKYGVPKQAHVHVEAAVGSEGLTKISISVVNTGPTIPADELELIFSGFVRGSDASKRRIPGTGLGLAVSRRMAIAMGGTLEATSADNLTELKFQVSLRETTPAATTAPSAEKTAPRKRILVVEDEPYNRIVLEHLLKDLGQQADWASDGASALEKVRSENYDLVLMDIALPDTTGFELAKKVREQRPLTPPAIIAVTAYCTPEKLAEAHSAGILTVLTKPISEKKLFEIVGSSQCPQKPNS
jgi:signal transduction histidine kinase/ActR/RegA family two-component response regulator/outer membrane protein assembly factor BamB